MSRTRLVLVRHGQTDWNSEGRFQGQADVPLNDLGRAQADAVAPFIAALRPARVISSDLRRASDTARAIAAAAGLGVVLDPRLQEIHIGDWAGRYGADVARELPWMEKALLEGRDFRRSATGETAAETGARVAGALREYAASFPGEVTVAVGHGLGMRTAVLDLLGLGLREGRVLAGLWNCSWSILEGRAEWRLLSFNNVVPGFDGVLPSLSAR